MLKLGELNTFIQHEVEKHVANLYLLRMRNVHGYSCNITRTFVEALFIIQSKKSARTSQSSWRNFLAIWR